MVLLRKKYIKDIVISLENDKEQFKKMYYHIFGKKISDCTWEYIDTNCFEDLITFKKKLCLAAWKNQFKRHPFSTVSKLIEHAVLEMGRLRFFGKGLRCFQR